MAKAALLIGTSEYTGKLKPLASAERDVEAMQRVLQQREMGGFAAEDVEVLLNADPKAIELAIYRLYANRGSEDLVLFYFSGHGVIDRRGKLYLTTPETEKDAVSGEPIGPTAVTASYIHEQMNRSFSKRQVAILDCCFSGAFGEELAPKDDATVNVEAQLGGKGRAILTSSDAIEYAFEQKGAELSVYTRFLVEGMETGAADLDGDGWITADELHDYASQKVRDTSPAMTPRFFPVEEGFRIRLARAPLGDPRLEYRKEVEQIAREDEGEIDPILSRHVLDELRDRLELSREAASEIEAEVLQPYQELKAKLTKYRGVYEQAIARRSPLSARDVKRLKQLQKAMGLRDEDLGAIAEELTSVVPTSPPPKKKPESKEGLSKFSFAIVKVYADGQETSRSEREAWGFREELGKGVEIEMVQIPSGTFQMGQTEAEKETLIQEVGEDDYKKYYARELPRHAVKVPLFYLGKYPVTQAQWKAVAGLPQVECELNPDPAKFKGSDRVVEQVSWHEAVEFCARLTKQVGREYRLPSEAEWEYACRAGTETPFHFGETITAELANYRGAATYGKGPKGTYRRETTEVGSFKVANAYGLYNMHGNVREWCADPWHENYEGAPTDGSAWLEGGSEDYYLLRGGSWSDLPRNCRSALRVRHGPGNRYLNFGFRVVCVAPRTG